ncbi:MAG: hypothetical protein ACLU9S_11415 [Oscillospiraceae bacterium]
MKRLVSWAAGVGCAIALPSAVGFKEAACEVDVIVGFRNKDIVILEDESKACADNLYLMTDDVLCTGAGPFCHRKLQQLLESGRQHDECPAIGPIPMMQSSPPRPPEPLRQCQTVATPEPHWWWDGHPARRAVVAVVTVGGDDEITACARRTPTLTAIRWTAPSS